jgi:hypothetical protein
MRKGFSAALESLCGFEVAHPYRDMIDHERHGGLTGARDEVIATIPSPVRFG